MIRKKRKVEQTPTELVRRLLQMVMKSDQPSLAAQAIVEANAFNLGPSEDDLSAWLARVTKPGAFSYKELRSAYWSLRDDELLDAVVSAAIHQGELLSLSKDADFENYAWSQVPDVDRWALINTSVRAGVAANQVFGEEHEDVHVLELHLLAILPTLIEDPALRVEWLEKQVPDMCPNMDLSTDFGGGVADLVAQWSPPKPRSSRRKPKSKC